MSTTEKKARRPKARAKDVVLGAIAERLDILDLMAQRDEAAREIGLHVSRVRELLDELRRSQDGKAESDE